MAYKDLHYLPTPRPERAKPRSAAAMALSVALFPIWFPFWAYAVFLAAQFDRTRDFSKWLYGRYECYRYGGFTLIELSIVLVIIGLIVGGVLAGQELISKAAVRAQISQIEKFNAAANTFFGKFGYLPGDIPPGPAAQFGFAPRGTQAGQGDGNGILQGGNSAGWGWVVGLGETAVFWVDLSAAHLIDQSFSTASETTYPSNNVTASTTPNIAAYMPQAAIGNGNFIYVWSTSDATIQAFNDSYPGNYFGISSVSAIGTNGKVTSLPGITVAQAYALDAKIDDGMPLSGRVQAVGVSNDPLWSIINTWGVNPDPDILYTLSLSGDSLTPSSLSCFDNGGNASNITQYSTSQNNGAGVNCALSFRMQAGD